jgi:hypothetical protein
MYTGEAHLPGNEIGLIYMVYSQAGGVYVDRAARRLLEQKLATSSKFNSEEILGEMTKVFEQKVRISINV